VQLHEDTDRKYHLADLVEAINAMPALPGATLAIDTGRGFREGPMAAELATRVVREGGVDGVTPFDALTSVMGHWLRNARLDRCSYDEAWAAVGDNNAAMIVPPWDDARLRGEFDALGARDILNHGPPRVSAATADGLAEPTSFLPEQSDDAFAAAFVAAHETCWRHVAVRGAWFHRTGTQW
jgi:hypothetical protein